MSSEPEMRATPRRVLVGTDAGTRQYSWHLLSYQLPAISLQLSASICTSMMESSKAGDVIAQLGPATPPKL